jgi:hypothetical protein
MKPKTLLKIVDKTALSFKCDEDGFDTRVEINNTYFCTITWKDRLEFIEEFKALLTKYRI